MDILLILFNVVFYKLIGANKSTKNDGPDTDQSHIGRQYLLENAGFYVKSGERFPPGKRQNLLLEGKWKKKSQSV
jgi:hypothetical protein